MTKTPADEDLALAGLARADEPHVTLTEFLLARIAEDEAAAIRHQSDASAHGWGDYPARVLADCEAKRRIVELHRRNEVLADLGILIECLEGCIGAYPCETIRALALPYADHPDYLPEWNA